MFKLKKTNTIEHPCRLRQLNEDGSVSEATLRVRFNVIDRAEIERWSENEEDDDQLVFDKVVSRIVDKVQGEDGEELNEETARAQIRNDLSLSNQITTQYWELMNGTAARKNGKRSQGR